MYDLAIIGAGPAGYTAAKRAAELGAQVCIIEKERLGGVCLNKGCVPVKFMVNTASLLSNIKKSGQFGIDAESYRLNIAKMLERREFIIDKLRKSIERLLNRSKVKIIKGQAKLKDPNTIDVSGKDLKAKYIIIATGSVPIETDILRFDHKNIISSADALNLKEIPSSLIIVGAGYIGCEFACIYNQFGCDVTIVEIESQILPKQDQEIATRLMQSMKKRGIKIILNAKIKSLEIQKDDKAAAVLEDNQTIKAQKVLLTIGRKPNIQNLNLESGGVKTENGSVVVNNNLKSTVDNIYAVGDVLGGFFLAYTAFYEGILAAENIFSQGVSVDYGVVPNCIFTIPEVASVGLTETQAKQLGYDVTVAGYPFMALSKAHILDQTEGIVKLIADSKTDKILGAQICGPQAVELIAELVIVMHNNMTAKDLSCIIHAHPTLSEAIQEAAKNIKK